MKSRASFTQKISYIPGSGQWTSEQTVRLSRCSCHDHRWYIPSAVVYSTESDGRGELIWITAETFTFYVLITVSSVRQFIRWWVNIILFIIIIVDKNVDSKKQKNTKIWIKWWWSNRVRKIINFKNKIHRWKSWQSVIVQFSLS